MADFQAPTSLPENNDANALSLPQMTLPTVCPSCVAESEGELPEAMYSKCCPCHVLTRKALEIISKQA